MSYMNNVFAGWNFSPVDQAMIVAFLALYLICAVLYLWMLLDISQRHNWPVSHSKGIWLLVWLGGVILGFSAIGLLLYYFMVVRAKNVHSAEDVYTAGQPSYNETEVISEQTAKQDPRFIAQSSSVPKKNHKIALSLIIIPSIFMALPFELNFISPYIPNSIALSGAYVALISLLSSPPAVFFDDLRSFSVN
jgi:hypothetical protein